MNSKDISRSYDRREIEALTAKSHVETGAETQPLEFDVSEADPGARRVTGATCIFGLAKQFIEDLFCSIRSF
jgi:hypothetical protein